MMKINAYSGINTELIKQGHLKFLQRGRKRELGTLFVVLSNCELRKVLTESCLYFCNAYSLTRVLNPYCFHQFLTICASPQHKTQQHSYASTMHSFSSPFIHVYQQQTGNRRLLIRYHSHQINPFFALPRESKSQSKPKGGKFKKQSILEVICEYHNFQFEYCNKF